MLYAMARTGLTPSQSILAYRAFVEVIKAKLKVDEAVQVRKLGTFLMRDLPAEVIRHPRTGVKTQYPARRVPVCVFDKGFKMVAKDWPLSKKTPVEP